MSFTYKCSISTKCHRCTEEFTVSFEDLYGLQSLRTAMDEALRGKGWLCHPPEAIVSENRQLEGEVWMCPSCVKSYERWLGIGSEAPPDA